ncbi:MAG: 3-methyladenine glycosylase [Herbinix sp.]|jgi:DNA-3-methyladenine glycosylase I|nr:3-methyladenine glycosylase [Herbinix sp.]
MSACLWPGENQLMQQYHDKEWCVPSQDDSYIFEMLTLEGAQSGLSWNTILTKREEYKKAFHNFDINYCSNLTDEELETIRDSYGIIKNLPKIKSVRNNAIAVTKLQMEFKSFSNYLWSFVDHTPVVNQWNFEGQVPAQSELSERISKDLKKRGFKFVGPVIIYSFMQAVGMVDDHIKTCPYHSENRGELGKEYIGKIY